VPVKRGSRNVARRVVQSAEHLLRRPEPVFREDQDVLAKNNTEKRHKWLILRGLHEDWRFSNANAAVLR